jgi:hypothetical protein
MGIVEGEGFRDKNGSFAIKGKSSKAQKFNAASAWDWESCTCEGSKGSSLSGKCYVGGTVEE